MDKLGSAALSVCTVHSQPALTADFRATVKWLLLATCFEIGKLESQVCKNYMKS